MLSLVFLAAGCGTPPTPDELSRHYAPLAADLAKEPLSTKTRLRDLRRYDPHPEWADMAIAIATDRWMSPEGAWWRPGSARLGWQWLSGRFDATRDGKVEKGDLTAHETLFDRLDADQSGTIDAVDFDPSRPDTIGEIIDVWFGLLDSDSNGRVSQDDFAQFVKDADTLATGFLDQEDLRNAAMKSRMQRGEPPTTEQMLTRLYAGELGSFAEGPQLGDTAPEFELPTHDGKSKARLSASRGKKPVVLVFGSFT